MSFITPLFARLMARFEKPDDKILRQELLAHAYGEVLELGGGTGASLDLYPDQVTRLVLTEPNKDLRRILERKVSSKGLDDIQVSDGTAEHIQAEDEAFDCVVALEVFCCVPNPGTALEEVKRVLKPGGYFVFSEHVAAAEGTSRQRWQNRINTLWRAIGGCHLDRETEAAIKKAGFKMKDITRENDGKGLGKILPFIRGVAEKPI